jgi:excisionase family DNA binding protein
VSLWFELHVNSDAVGRLVIRRISNVGVHPRRDGHEHDDMVSTYLIVRDGAEIGTLRHRYGDGPWILARNALDLAVAPPGEMGGRAAARRLRVHESTIKNYAAKGDLPFTRTPGGHRRYKGSDVDALRPAIEASKARKGMT